MWSFSAIEGVEEVKAVDGVQEVTITKNIGDEVTEIRSSLDRCGFVISQCDNATDAIGCCEKAKKIIRLKV